MFKSGDRVRVLNYHFYGGLVGEEGVVVRVDNDAMWNAILVYFEHMPECFYTGMSYLHNNGVEDSYPRKCLYIIEEDLELVEEISFWNI